MSSPEVDFAVRVEQRYRMAKNVRILELNAAREDHTGVRADRGKGGQRRNTEDCQQARVDSSRIFEGVMPRFKALCRIQNRRRTEGLCI